MITNPYAVTTLEAPGEGTSTSIWRGLVFGLAGYVAPFAIFFPMCWMSYGWLAVSDNFDRFVTMHCRISLSGLAALAPNVACMVLFGIAGYQRPLMHRFLGFGISPFVLGLATLLGYFLVLLVTLAWFPLPWTWPALLNNSVRSGLVALLPLSIVAYRLVSARGLKRST